MNKELPFLARFLKRRVKNHSLSGEYSEKNDLHMKMINGEKIPLILTEGIFPETKTITEVRRERED